MILFDSINIEKPVYLNEHLVPWIAQVIEMHGRRIGEIKYIFVDDEYLYKININYLNHSTYTDIITFDFSENSDFVSGELYISLERVIENASHLNKSIENELFRVMIHGVLHLLGFKDKLPEDETEMRRQEEKCLSLLP